MVSSLMSISARAILVLLPGCWTANRMPALVSHEPHARNIGLPVTDEDHVGERQRAIVVRHIFVREPVVANLKRAPVDSEQVLRLGWSSTASAGHLATSLAGPTISPHSAGHRLYLFVFLRICPNIILPTEQSGKTLRALGGQGGERLRAPSCEQCGMSCTDDSTVLPRSRIIVPRKYFVKARIG
jgi:hypothetical protein